MSETAVQQRVMLEWASQGGQVWRNNVGVAIDLTGRHIRYGLANISKKMNKDIKSSDLIGITPVLIQQHHVGRVMGVFTATECKPSGWTFKLTDERAVAQKNYHDIVTAVGGLAGFATGPDDYYRIMSLR